MTSETKATDKPTDKPGDPADRAADGAFGGVTPHATHSHRAGYGDDKLGRLVAWMRAHPTTTLASGEGALLLAEIDRLRDDLQKQADWADWAKDEIDMLRVAFKIERANTLRLERILRALREPSEAVLMGAHQQLRGIFPGYLVPVIRAAVTTAEQEVGRE